MQAERHVEVMTATRPSHARRRVKLHTANANAQTHASAHISSGGADFTPCRFIATWWECSHTLTIPVHRNGSAAVEWPQWRPRGALLSATV